MASNTAAPHATRDAHAHDAHEAHDHHPTGWRRFVYSTNHKDIGTMYLVFALVAGVIGGLMSIAIRLELASIMVGRSGDRIPAFRFFRRRTSSMCS